MDSKRERASIDDETIEFGFEGVETANKLRVLYLFEGDIRFTDSFKETIQTINEDDGHWADYNELYESIIEMDQAQDVPLNEPLVPMVGALLTLHLARLNLNYKDEDFDITATFLCALYSFEWDRLLTKATLSRDGWLPLLRARAANRVKR